MVLRDHCKAGQRGVNLCAALAAVADGKPRTAKQIVEVAIAQRLLPHGANAQMLYVSLVQYLARAKDSGRLQLIVQDPDRRFRANHPIDDWPDSAEPLASRSAARDVDAFEKRLRELARGFDPEAFECAICEAFEALGFRLASHRPTGRSRRRLGRAARPPRVSRDAGVQDHVRRHRVTTRAAEAAKWRESYGGDYAFIIGPGFGEADSEFMSELALQHVSAWSVDDLVAALRIATDPDELRAVFAPGYAEDHLPGSSGSARTGASAWPSRRN